MGELNLETLDVSDAEILNAPEPEPTPAVEPVVDDRPRDPATGQFVAQAPAAAPDPVKAAEPPQGIPPVLPAVIPAVPAEAVTVPLEQPRVIPLAAHLEERNRWKQQVEERDRQLAAINERIAKLEPVIPVPDFIEDPKAYVDAKAQQTSQELEALKAQAAQLTQETQFGRFVQEIGTQEADFATKNPDYYEALDHVRGIRTQQLTYLYPAATPDQITQELRREEIMLAANLMQLGKSPAEGFYQTAKITFGYKGKAIPAAALPVVPVVPKAPVGDPGNTLGSSGGAPADEAGVAEMGEDDLGPLHEAIRERFGKRA